MSRIYRRYLYNIYANNELIAENKRPIECVDITGCHEGMVNTYAKDGTTYHNKKDSIRYNFTVSDEVTKETKEKLKIIREKAFETPMDEDWINDWEKIRFKLNPNAKKWQKAVNV